MINEFNTEYRIPGTAYVKYKLNGGTNHASNVYAFLSSEGISTLYDATLSGDEFMGWYDGENNLVTSIPVGTVDNVVITSYSIHYTKLYDSSVSIPSNIAEGYGRHQTKDYIRFLSISSGSLYEMETQLEISRRQGYVDQEKYDEVISLSSEIERMLSSLINKLKRTINK